jgi:hypothetical protein
MFYPENVLDLKNCACNNECMSAGSQPASHQFKFLNAAISLHASLPLPKPRRFFRLSPIDTSTGISLRLGVFVSFLHVGMTTGAFARLAVAQSAQQRVSQLLELSGSPL